MRLPRALLLASALMLGLAACDSAEERAERHFRTAEALAAAGDVDRALVELRNVFRLDGAHREARRRYAELQIGRGELQDGYGNLLRLVEFYPDDLDARLQLAELALVNRAWDEVERHGAAARDLAPEAPRVRAIAAALDYRAALRTGDAAARDAVAAEARAVLEVEPETLAARMVVVDHLIAAGADAAALEQLDLALLQAPVRRDLHDLRLRLLVRAGEDAAAGAQLRRMVDVFPADTALREAVLAWHAERGQVAEAEAFLRAQMDDAAADDGWPRLSLVRLIRSDRGAEAAMAEIDRMQAEGMESLEMGRLRAELTLAEGDLDGAIAQLTALLAGAPDGPADGAARNDLEVRLAQLLLARGDTAGARARVAAVLAADAGHVEALKLEAGWLIADDRAGDALLALRRALARAPRDADIMLLMADAHLRDGSRDLAGERLALAVEVSGSGARESLRYAQHLAEQGRLGPAEAVLEAAQRARPGDLRLWVALGELWLQRGDLDRAAGAVAALRQTDDPGARRAAETLQAALFARQDRAEETVALMEGLLGDDTLDLSAVGVILQTRLATGDIDAAAAWLDDLMARRGAPASLRFLRAGLHLLADEPEPAEALYRALLAERPEAEAPAVALYRLLQETGRTDEADAVLAAGLAAQPGSVQLRWLQAGTLEAAGDIEGAIAVYETLYAEDTGNEVFANNLASLLAEVRDDADSLERALMLARRLRSSEVPAFRSTFGWIEHRRGNHADALPHLAHAAEALPEAGWAQFRLGMALAALERGPEARAALDRALELGGLTPERQAAAEAARARLEPAGEMGQ